MADLIGIHMKNGDLVRGLGQFRRTIRENERRAKSVGMADARRVIAPRDKLVKTSRAQRATEFAIATPFFS